MPDTVGIDPEPIHPADATTLMAHHLMLASAYFEVCPDEQGPALAAIARVFPRNKLALGAARLWLGAINAAYDAEA